MYWQGLDMERPNLDDFIERAGIVLDEEEVILEGLKMAVRAGNYTEDEAEEYMTTYYRFRNAND